MRLATLKDGSRDGTLVVVSRDLSRAARTSMVAKTLQQALDGWAETASQLSQLCDEVNAGGSPETFAFEPQAAAPPLPRAYQWCDGSAFLSHGLLMEQAYHLEPPPDAETIPLIYQGGSDDFVGPCDDVPMPDETYSIDFEGEYGVVVDDVPMGCTPEQAVEHLKLVVLLNDWSLRAFGPREMKTGFGFFLTKPATSFAPVAVTPDELGGAWRNGRVHLPLNVYLNGAQFGRPSGAEMHFTFFDLIAHAARTRRLRAGTIVGSGTVSNADRSAGCACIAERRVIEILDHGAPTTGFMRFGDMVRMEVLDAQGRSVFGAIDQRVVRAPVPARGEA